MNYVLFDPGWRAQLLPFTHTRPVADIRCGIFSFRERWEHLLGTSSSTLCPAYLQELFPHAPERECTYINGAVFASKELVDAMQQLPPETALMSGTQLLALRLNTPFSGAWEDFAAYALSYRKQAFETAVGLLSQPWEIFQKNGTALSGDFSLITRGRTSAPLPDYVTALHPENIFVEPGARLNPCILNASSGPIYIASGAEVMDGSMIRGPFALGAHATVKMGAKIYGPTTVGPHCKVGGEVNNVVFFANSNKGHDGYLGNSVVGEWCNFGADTNCSNLKNNYDKVKIWSEEKQQLVDTGLQFCGLLMGDHSKCGINTMFNTGTVVGVSANIFGAGFPDKYIPSFTWGACDSSSVYQFDKAMETAKRVMERRGKQLSNAENAMLRHLFNTTTKN